MLLTDKRAWLFSAKLYVAAVATLGISLLGGLARPYWAMATVYVVSQPVLGLTRARVRAPAEQEREERHGP